MSTLIKIRLVCLATLLTAASVYADPVRVCAMTPSQTAALDGAVAKLVFNKMAVATTAVDLSAGDDPAPANNPAKIAHLLQSRCDVIVGVPLSAQGDKPQHTVSAPYLDASFVQFSRKGTKLQAAGRGQFAVAYSSPGQVIMAERGKNDFEVVNTQDQVIASVMSGHTQYGIAWRPSLLGYEAAHKGVHFVLRPLHSSIANWQVSFVADASRAELIARIHATLTALDKSGQLSRLSAAQLRVPSTAKTGDDGDPD